MAAKSSADELYYHTRVAAERHSYMRGVGW